MEKIASFQIDHLRLPRGLFVSRIDRFGQTVITTFDIRLKVPNKEPVAKLSALHTLEHLGATFLRSHPAWSHRIVYFGPMGCSTGIYAVIEGELSSQDFLPLAQELFDWLRVYEGPIPGASPKECGNWTDHDLELAKKEADQFYNEILENPATENLIYPE